MDHVQNYDAYNYEVNFEFCPPVECIRNQKGIYLKAIKHH
jgi:hypothetical protein